MSDEKLLNGVVGQVVGILEIQRVAGAGHDEGFERRRGGEVLLDARGDGGQGWVSRGQTVTAAVGDVAFCRGGGRCQRKGNVDMGEEGCF